MQKVPPQLLDGLAPPDEAKAVAWWSGLGDAARSQVADLCDPRRDACFFGAVPADAVASLPLVIGGRFVPRDDVAGWEEWHAALFEHLLCNPELVLFTPTVVRTYHICTRHEAARAALRTGRIPVDFRCPLASEDCPMRRVLDQSPNAPMQQNGAALQLFEVNSPTGGPAVR